MNTYKRHRFPLGAPTRYHQLRCLALLQIQPEQALEQPLSSGIIDMLLRGSMNSSYQRLASRTGNCEIESGRQTSTR